MAKLTSLLHIDGTLQGLTVYKLPGIEAPVVRVAAGPTKEDIDTHPRYDGLRRNLAENRGRNGAVSSLMKAFQPLKPLADADTAGQLNKLLRAVQKADTASAWGQRAVRCSQHAHLLEGFNLTKALPFDSVVRGEVAAVLHRDTLEASVQFPELIPRLTFFPPAGYAYCRLVAVLGVAPDLLFGLPKYRTEGDYSNCYAQAAQTGWFAAGKGAPATTLSLALPYTPPTEAFALVLTVGVQLGEPGLGGGIEPVRRRLGSSKILAAV